jgi:hypothetical protein
MFRQLFFHSAAKKNKSFERFQSLGKDYDCGTPESSFGEC